jgi:hypothetical protein
LRIKIILFALAFTVSWAIASQTSIFYTKTGVTRTGELISFNNDSLLVNINPEGQPVLRSFYKNDFSSVRLPDGSNLDLNLSDFVTNPNDREEWLQSENDQNSTPPNLKTPAEDIVNEPETPVQRGLVISEEVESPLQQPPFSEPQVESSSQKFSGLSFHAGPSWLFTRASHSTNGSGAGMHFDMAIPSKAYEGFYYGVRSFFAISNLGDYVNTQVDDNPNDLDREFFWAGVVLGPTFKTKGKTYFTGHTGLLIAANYATEIRYGPSNRSDNKVYSEVADLSMGAEGALGIGFRFIGGRGIEFTMVVMAAGSENSPGIMLSGGPKMVFGLEL